MTLCANSNRLLVWKRAPLLPAGGGGGEENLTVGEDEEDSRLTLEEHSVSSGGHVTKLLEFHWAFVLTRDRTQVYVCSEEGDVLRLGRRGENGTMTREHRIPNAGDRIYSLVLSHDESYLVGVFAPGYKTWDLRTDELKVMDLPIGARNIPKYVG